MASGATVAEHRQRIVRAALLVVATGASWNSLIRDGSSLRLVLAAAVGLLIGLQFGGVRGWRTRGVVVALAIGGLAVLTAGSAGGGVVGSGWSARGVALREAGRVFGHGAFPTPTSAGILGVELGLLMVTAVVAALACRRSLTAVGATLAAVAYAWTLAPPAHPLPSGAILACALLVSVGGPGPERVRIAAGLVLAGVALAASVPLVSTASLVNWRTWSFTGGPAPASSVISFDQRYGQLDWPATPTVVLRVSAPLALPMRAAVLPTFADGRFTFDPNSPDDPLTVQGDRIILDAGASGGIEQRVTYSGSESAVVLAGGRPTSLSGPFKNATASTKDGAIRISPTLSSGSQYVVTTTSPDPGIAALASAAPLPADSADLQLDARTRVSIPAWRPGSRTLPARRFGVYSPVAELAGRTAAGATNEYEVVVRTEALLRERFEYREQPPTPVGDTPWLVDFVATTHQGFCQQFAGAMALMLRMDGIPARVAVGFTAGVPDSSGADYVIVDRDAHSWVEVFFPGYGWLPFDPTPGRSAPNRASVSSFGYSLKGLKLPSFGAPLPSRPVRPVRPGSAATTTPIPPTSPPGALAPPQHGTALWPWLIGLAGLMVPLFPGGVKYLRRRRRRLSGSATARTLAAGHEVSDLLRDLALPEPGGATGTERAAALHRRTGISAEAFYRCLGRARFGGGDVSETDADTAWAAHDELRAALRSGSSWPRWVAGLATPRSLRPPSLP